VKVEDCRIWLPMVGWVERWPTVGCVRRWLVIGDVKWWPAESDLGEKLFHGNNYFQSGWHNRTTKVWNNYSVPRSIPTYQT
jgi:hypothetical protein